MAARVVSTAEFWEAMCHPAFLRMSPNTGRLRADFISTDVPPESVDGWMAEQMALMADHLRNK